MEQTMSKGTLINTVYGKAEIIKVNAKSVVVQIRDQARKISMKQVEIMNHG